MLIPASVRGNHKNVLRETILGFPQVLEQHLLRSISVLVYLTLCFGGKSDHLAAEWEATNSSRNIYYACLTSAKQLLKVWIGPLYICCCNHKSCRKYLKSKCLACKLLWTLYSPQFVVLQVHLKSCIQIWAPHTREILEFMMYTKRLRSWLCLGLRKLRGI